MLLGAKGIATRSKDALEELLLCNLFVEDGDLLGRQASLKFCVTNEISIGVWREKARELRTMASSKVAF